MNHYIHFLVSDLDNGVTTVGESDSHGGDFYIPVKSNGDCYERYFVEYCVHGDKSKLKLTTIATVNSNILSLNMMNNHIKFELKSQILNFIGDKKQHRDFELPFKKLQPLSNLDEVFGKSKCFLIGCKL